MYNYDTLTEALADLRKRNYTFDFSLSENCLVCNNQRFNTDDFEITEVYRFDNATDPDDEAVLYVIESKNGVKGVLVSGYGVSAEGMSAEMAQKLRIKRKN
jgi:hypothetical protein